MKLVTQHPHACIVTATKPLIDALIAMNTRNRKPRQTAIDRLRIDIEAGQWKLTASGVGVDWNGHLCDGQHRLYAIVEAGYPPVQFVLTTGLDPASQAVVDRHAKRSLSDALSMMTGRTVSTAIVAAANSLLSIKNATSPKEPFVYASRHPSDSQAAACLIEWEDDLAAVLSAAGGNFRSSIVAALAIYHRHDPERAVLFADQLRRGLGLSETDPAYKMRSILETALVRNGGAQGSIRAFCYTVSAILAHSQGRELRLLKGSDSWSNHRWGAWKA